MALDYGMALARGLIAPQKELQAEVKELAGNQFKSEEWWNKQLDRQIKEGMRKYETATEYKTKSGSFVLGKRATRSTGMYPGSRMETFYDAPKDAIITGYTGHFYTGRKPTYETRKTRVVGKGREDLTSAQLKAIENQAKETGAKAKKEAAKSKKGKRAARGSSGLMGRSSTKDVGLAAGLPSLGSLGLGIGETKLG